MNLALIPLAGPEGSSNYGYLLVNPALTSSGGRFQEFLDLKRREGWAWVPGNAEDGSFGVSGDLNVWVFCKEAVLSAGMDELLPVPALLAHSATS